MRGSWLLTEKEDGYLLRISQKMAYSVILPPLKDPLLPRTLQGSWPSFGAPQRVGLNTSYVVSVVPEKHVLSKKKKRKKRKKKKINF